MFNQVNDSVDFFVFCTSWCPYSYDVWGGSDRNATALADHLCTADKKNCQTLEDYTARLGQARTGSDAALASIFGVHPHDLESTHLTIYNPLAKKRSTTVAVSLKVRQHADQCMS